MNKFFDNLWNNIKHGYCFARDYVARKIAQLNVYGDRLLAEGRAKDDFAKTLYGAVCKAGAFVSGFFVAFAIGYTIGVVASFLLGPILGLLAIPVAYMFGEDFGAAIARAEITARLVDAFRSNVAAVVEVEDVAFTAAAAA
jgi:hypothetical protein